MNPRQQKELEIATGYRIRESAKGFLVPYQSGQGAYVVTFKRDTQPVLAPTLSYGGSAVNTSTPSNIR